MPVLDVSALATDRIEAIRRLHDSLGNRKAELDVSGGVDSAVMLGLLARALGPESITAVFSGIHSSESSRTRAREAAEAQGVQLVELELSSIFDRLVESLLDGLERADHDLDEVRRRMETDPTVMGSFRSCLRAPIGRALNRMTGGAIRHGTGNECEDKFLRFYQKGGDGEVDTNPIAMLSKGEVYQLGLELGVPHSILEATPSPDLHGIGVVHDDEAELFQTTGVAWTYSRIDVQTGEYTTVGTIERMGRFLDTQSGHELLEVNPLTDGHVASMLDTARGLFPDTSDAEIERFLRSAHALERGTRHKWNPNIPELGSRAQLVEAGLLTDTLPAHVS